MLHYQKVFTLHFSGILYRNPCLTGDGLLGSQKSCLYLKNRVTPFHPLVNHCFPIRRRPGTTLWSTERSFAVNGSRLVILHHFPIFPTANLLGFNLWGWVLVTRKCPPRKSGTVLEPCWNLSLLGCKAGLIFPSRLPTTGGYTVKNKSEHRRCRTWRRWSRLRKVRKGTGRRLGKP